MSTRTRKPARRARGRPGFTLIEMLAVIAILGILFTAAVIGFNQFGRGARLRTSTRAITDHLSYARQLAVTNRGIYGVEFDTDPDAPQFRVYYVPTGTTSKVTVGSWVRLQQGVAYATGASSPPSEVEFKPTGSAVSGGTFRIYDTETGRQRQIVVVAITGHTKVSTD